MSVLQQMIQGLAGDAAPDEPTRLKQRIEWLDRLEPYLSQPSPSAETTDAADSSDYARAQEIQQKFEKENRAIYKAIREEIRRGDGRSELGRWLSHDTDTGEHWAHQGFDYADEILAGVLQLGEPGATIVDPTTEMVFYQPTPTRHIVDLFERTELGDGDVLMDIGSGLGHVPMLAAILTEARSIGVEVEPVYVECARRAARSLNLERVTFIESDARTAPLNSGTVFYLYTPFSGSMMRTMLDLLREEGRRREIRVCTLGPCTATVSNESWLYLEGESSPNRITIFRSTNRV